MNIYGALPRSQGALPSCSCSGTIHTHREVITSVSVLQMRTQSFRVETQTLTPTSAFFHNSLGEKEDPGKGSPCWVKVIRAEAAVRAGEEGLANGKTAARREEVLLARGRPPPGGLAAEATPEGLLAVCCCWVLAGSPQPPASPQAAMGTQGVLNEV